MRQINLDFQAITSPNAWAGWLLLLLGGMFCADVFFSYTSLKSETTQNRLMTPTQNVTNDDVAANIQLAQQYEQALAVVDRLAFPWATLLSTLESVPTTGVGILEITPHPQDHLLILRGEAANFAAMLTYVAGLEQTPIFYDVYLEKHEVKKSGGSNAIAFTLSASWAMP